MVVKLKSDHIPSGTSLCPSECLPDCTQMEMETSLNVKSSADVDASDASHFSTLSNCSRLISSGLKEIDDPSVDFLNEFDSYWEDIDARLTISRMVSDSVIRGMIKAVEQEAANKIAQKDLELRKLKESLEFYEPKKEQKNLLSSFSRSSCESLTKEILTLQLDLDSISKLLCGPEIGHLSSHGSFDIDELSNPKPTDHLHRKVSGNHVLLSATPRQGNEKLEESVMAMSENLDTAHLKTMTNDELVNYFTNEMAKMKRDYDYKVQEMTEEYYSLKREFLKLKERGSNSLSLRKDKDFNFLRKNILDATKSLDNLRDRLESYLSENHQLRDMQTDKKEVSCLSSQVPNVAKKMSQQSCTEESIVERVEYLEFALEDSYIESSVKEDLYKCLLSEVVGQIECISEMKNIEHDILKEIYYAVYKNAACDAVPIMKCEPEDLNLVSLIEEDVCVSMFKEAYIEAMEQLDELKVKEIALRRDNEELKQFILSIEASLDEKENLMQETTSKLEMERKQHELASHELHQLSFQMNQKDILISKYNEESDTMKDELALALEQIERDKIKLYKLNEKFESQMRELRESSEEKRRLLAIAQDKENALTLFEIRDMENRKQMENLIVHGFSNAIFDVERRITKDIQKNNLRLESLGSQLNSLHQTASKFKILELQYKKKLEKKSSNLEKAEAEVDILGDEVDALLSLLEKIYIALDHYSPILRHYPGIMETLKLVRRELTGESIKTV